MTPIHRDDFWHEGRGPELQRIVWAHEGCALEAIEYVNPDWSGEAADLRHIRFRGVQVVQITPEEVINYATFNPLAGGDPQAAAFDLGRSPWLESFSPRHLAKCSHFRLMFYDELVDVICEEVTFGRGAAT